VGDLYVIGGVRLKRIVGPWPLPLSLLLSDPEGSGFCIATCSCHKVLPWYSPKTMTWYFQKSESKHIFPSVV
jgi:hypothetical protein